MAPRLGRPSGALRDRDRKIGSAVEVRRVARPRGNRFHRRPRDSCHGFIEGRRTAVPRDPTAERQTASLGEYGAQLEDLALFQGTSDGVLAERNAFATSRMTNV